MSNSILNIIRCADSGGGYGQQGPPGPPGPQGPAGPQGPVGENGKTILNGIVPPDNSIGTDGDFYLDTIALMLYGPKSGGVWPSGISLQNTVEIDDIIERVETLEVNNTGINTGDETQATIIDKIGYVPASVDDIIQPFTELKIFTYDGNPLGTSHVIPLDFDINSVGSVFFTNQPPLSVMEGEYMPASNSIIINPSILTSGVQYNVNIFYFKPFQ